MQTFVLKMSFRFTLLCLGLITLLAGCAESPNGLVLMLDPSYEPFVEATEKQGLSSPDGLLSHAGKILIADEGGSACREWDRATKTLKTLCERDAGIASPEDLVLDAEGNIFFTDDDVGGVWQIKQDGSCRSIAGAKDGLVETEAIALTPTGELLVGDGLGHQVFRVTRQGAVSVFLAPENKINKPESMVFDEEGNLFIADNRDNILYFLPAGGDLQRLVENQPDFSPESLWYRNGVLYLTDSHAGRIYRFTHSTGLEPIAVFGGSLRSVQGITTDEEDNIYVSVQSDLKRKIGSIVQLKKRSEPKK